MHTALSQSDGTDRKKQKFLLERNLQECIKERGRGAGEGRPRRTEADAD